MPMVPNLYYDRNKARYAQNFNFPLFNIENYTNN
jgi:hypothetical protein